MFDFFKIVYDKVFVFQLLAVSFSVVLVFYDWKKDRKNIVIGAAHIAGLFLVGTVLNWLLFVLSTVWRAVAGIHFQIAWFLTILLYLLVFDKTYVASRFIMGATIFIVAITMAEFGHEMSGYLGSVKQIDWDFICYISDVLIIASALLMCKYTLKDYNDIPVVSVVLIAITTFVSAFLIVSKTVMRMKKWETFNLYRSMELIALYIISAVIYLMVYYHCKVRKEKTILEVQNKLLEADKQMLSLSGKAIEEMRALRHDMRNQQKLMELMLHEKRYEDLEKYFESCEKSYDVFKPGGFIDSGNQFVNSVVNMEILKANSYGVPFVSRINVPQELPVDPSDFCRILSNLLDNAIEETLRSGKKDRPVDLKMNKHMDYLYVSVKNVIRSDVNKEELLRMNTTKGDATNHGYGHKIVKRIVEKYNGHVNYSVSEEEFIAEIMLVLNEEEKQ